MISVVCTMCSGGIRESVVEIRKNQGNVKETDFFPDSADTLLFCGFISKRAFKRIFEYTVGNWFDKL